MWWYVMLEWGVHRYIITYGMRVHGYIMTFSIKVCIYVMMYNMIVHVYVITYDVEIYVYIIICSMIVNIYIMMCEVGIHVHAIRYSVKVYRGIIIYYGIYHKLFSHMVILIYFKLEFYLFIMHLLCFKILYVFVYMLCGVRACTYMLWEFMGILWFFIICIMNYSCT